MFSLSIVLPFSVHLSLFFLLSFCNYFCWFSFPPPYLPPLSHPSPFPSPRLPSPTRLPVFHEFGSNTQLATTACWTRQDAPLTAPRRVLGNLPASSPLSSPSPPLPDVVTTNFDDAVTSRCTNLKTCLKHKALAGVGRLGSVSYGVWQGASDDRETFVAT